MAGGAEKAELKFCGVCGDKAFGYNFGALTCESCKAFFRRNAIKNKEFRCLFKDDCEVNTRTRRFCQRCRLQKCFSIGMKKECILSEAEKQEKRAKIEENRLKRALNPRPPGQRPDSYCSNSNGITAKAAVGSTPNTPLSSVTEDEDSSPAKVARYAEEAVSPGSEASGQDASAGPSKVPAGSRHSGCPLVKLESARPCTSDSWSSDDLLESSSSDSPSLVDVINMTDHAIRRLIKMSKRITAFKSLCQEDQVALLKGGSTELMLLRSVMSYDAERDCWKGPDPRLMSIKLDILKEARGNVYEEHKRFINAFRPEWRIDENIMLLLSAITLFTPERPNLVHRDVVTFEQDTYLYLLRRYLDTIYTGCESRSVFLQLIRNLEDMRTLNENQVSILVDLNPREVEPLLIEIFDLK
ncbi:nuclear hormone receptor 48, putative [Ixodes scapularis]|uniref:Nuclear hormone receptor 48, putative n=1 Tax=Ixodes scapularis TaxID=6945 RepID=B7PZ32_IXOSC|nr:nuclear hormone receptor 48, putative [Ixodes scapularis]|eukprot:XP_002404556.1 nuclear hormone receptor 48, putative [Ixodes scapularis]